MAETTTLCVSVQAGEHLLSGPDWLKVEDTKTLIDVLVEVSGTQALGYQVQVIVSQEPSFTEAALMQILNSVSMLRSSGSIYVKYLLKSSVLPSQQRYEESKCKAERDTDVPLIESLLSPVKEDKLNEQYSIALSFDSPFESNYLNKLLSDQKLSPTTLSSLKREIIKKKHLTDQEHYTTWQEQVVTSPVKDSHHAPVACHEPKPHGLTNWANDHKADSSTENEENSAGTSLTYEMYKMDDNEWNKKHHQVQHAKLGASDRSVKGQNAKNCSVDNSIEDTSTLDKNNAHTKNTKRKDEVKRAPIRKVIIPKTNRSTALRVKKNSVTPGGIQRNDKIESHRSGMPALSQKTTKSVPSKPNRTVKTKTSLLAAQEDQTKDPGCSVRKTNSSKTANTKKALGQPLPNQSRKPNCKNALLGSTRCEEPSNQLKCEDRVEIMHNKTKQGLRKADIGSSLKTKTKEKDLMAEEMTQKSDIKDQLYKDEDFKRVGDIAFVTEGGEKERNSELRFDRTDLDIAIVELGSATQNEIYDRSNHRGVLISSDSERPTIESDQQTSRTIAVDLSQAKSTIEYSFASPESAVMPTPNSSVFEFDNLDEKFATNTIDSIDEITIYETSNENRKGQSTIESSMLEAVLAMAEMKRDDTVNDNEVRAYNNQEKAGSHHSHSRSYALSPGNECTALSVENKDNHDISQPLEPNGHCLNDDRKHLSERPRFFQSFSNQSSYCKLLKGSFDSSDIVESSEMLSRAALNGSTSLKRSESLDRYPTSVEPKKIGFFHELKEKTKDADCSSFFSIKENDNQVANSSLPLNNDSSSSSTALSQDSAKPLFEDAGCLDSEDKSPPGGRQNSLDIALDKIHIGELSVNESSRLKTGPTESPTFISDIGRDSALSRTFSLESCNDSGALEASDETKGEIFLGISEKSNTVSNHKKQREIPPHEGEMTALDAAYQPQQDGMPAKCSLDFGEEIECHSRRKWNLESDIIDQLLASSLEDQCTSLRETAQRILSRLRSGKHEEENHLPSFEGTKQNSSDVVDDKIGMTGRVFKALQSLEKQLSEIENNLGK